MTAAQLALRGVARCRVTVKGIARELTGGAALAADVTSFLTFGRDVFGYRALRIVDPGERSLRVVRFKGDTVLTYRLNRGDVRAICETWIDEAYALPDDFRPRTIIDLGANIGATSVWFGKRYAPVRIVSLEPAPQNAALVRINLDRNGIEGEVIEAAVGAIAGVARFDVTDTSTLGKVGPTGIEVSVVTVQSLVDRFPPDEPIDLLKMDVEGAEVEVLSGDLGWLERVRCLVIEFHDGPDNAAELIGRVCAQGFSHVDISAQSGYLGVKDVMAVLIRASPESHDARPRALGVAEFI